MIKRNFVKPKKVVLDATIHKISNIIFAIFRDNTLFVLISPAEHRKAYDSQLWLAT